MIWRSFLNRRPDKKAVTTAIRKSGLETADLVFSVDEDGVDNADIYPNDATDEDYKEKVFLLMEWAAESGAAIGFHFTPRGSDA
jgi:hypothetical protein